MNIADFKVQSVASNYGYEIDNATTEARSLGMKNTADVQAFVEKKAKKHLKSLPLMGDLMILDFAYRNDPLIFGSQKWGDLVQSEVVKRLHSKEITERAKQYGYSSAKKYYEAKFEECCGENTLVD